MQQAELFLLFTLPLDTAGIPYMVGGIELSAQGGMWLAPPEYVIVRKLEYCREGHSEKHVHDIRGMLDTLGDSLDDEALAEWLARLELTALMQEVSAG